MDERFRHPTYMVRKKVLKLFGGAFHIYDTQENLVFFSEMKAFKLKEDIHVFTGEDKQVDLLSIKARQILDISATYDVTDAATGQKIGALRRKGMKSIIRDEWLILDANDQEIGMIQEDSMALALVRRFLFKFLPQKYSATIQNQVVATYKQNFNPFVLKITLDFSMDQQNLFDRRLGIASVILLSSIEGRQQ
jgi:uncharacterized protein YxjI